MPDKPVEERLNAVAERIKAALLALPKFRPECPVAAKDFDQMTAEMVDTLVEVSQAAAIDERALIFAKDRSDARHARMLSEQKLRGDYDAMMASLSGQVMLPFLRLSGAKL